MRILMKILSYRLVQALIMGGVGTVVTAVVVIQLRNWQNLQPMFDLFNLDPAYDWGAAVFFGVIGGAIMFLWTLGVFSPIHIFSGPPGLGRAVLLGLIGMLTGLAAVFVLRGLQGLDPIWDDQTGLVVAAFCTAGFFVYGMGAFDPRMSAHGEHLAEAEAELHRVNETPNRILGGYIWQVGTLALVIFALIFVFALLPFGPGLQVVGTADGATNMNGLVPVVLPFGGPTLQTTQFVVFIAFVFIALASLAIGGGLLGLVFFHLNQGLAEVRAAEPTPEELIPPLPARLLGQVFGFIGWIFSTGLAHFFGQK